MNRTFCHEVKDDMAARMRGRKTSAEREEKRRHLCVRARKAIRLFFIVRIPTCMCYLCEEKKKGRVGGWERIKRLFANHHVDVGSLSRILIFVGSTSLSTRRYWSSQDKLRDCSNEYKLRSTLANARRAIDIHSEHVQAPPGWLNRAEKYALLLRPSDSGWTGPISTWTVERYRGKTK